MTPGNTAPRKTAWFRSSWFIAFVTIFFAPVGAVLMWLFSRWPIWVKVVATVYALAYMLAFSSGGGSKPTTTVVPASTSASTSAVAQTAPQQSGQATVTGAAQAPAAAAKPTAAPTVPPTPKPAEAGRAWNAPIAYGQSATIEDGDREYRITITEVVRNATAQVKKANLFNKDAPSGMDYILVKAKLEYLKGPQDKPFTTAPIGHSVMAEARMWGPPTFAVAPEPKFADQDIFPGATVEGWLPPFIVPQDSMDSVILSYGKGLFGATGGTWFSLGEKTDKPAALPKLTPSANAIDASTAKQRDTAIPFKTAALFKDNDSLIEIQVVDVVRDATREVKAANSLNKDPTPGNGYLLVKLKARYISGPEDRPWTTPEVGQSVFALNRMFGNAPGLTVAPEPHFGGIDLYPGGEAEGWLPVMELPKDGLDAPILSYGKGLLGGGDTWFALQ